MPYPDIDLPIELLRDVPLLTLFLDGDAAALNRLVPAPLAVHPGHRVVLNIWVADAQTVGTGFGAPGTPVGIAYLAAEVAGPEGLLVDGSMHYPARFWLRHWCSNAAVRDYARRASGLTLESAAISLTQDGDRLRYRMKAEDGSRIDAGATLASTKRGAAASRSVYYALRAGEQGDEIARYDIPAVADAFEIEGGHAECHVAGGNGGIRDGVQHLAAASFRRMTLVPYIARGTLP